MKPGNRFACLDGMRGIAALAVGYFHSATLYTIWSTDHTQLAVGFFFCLSGFVIAHTYGEAFRDGMTIREFAARRVIRLHPLVVMGVAMGFLVLAAGILSHHGQFLGRTYDLGELIIGSLLCLFLIPAGMFLHTLYYFIDSPIWSLFFEYVANAGYALTRGRRFRPRTAVMALGASLCILIILAAAAGGITHFGLGSVTSFLAGFARVGFPFLAGVVISQFALYSRVSVLPDLLIAALFVAFLLYPFLQGIWQFDILSAALIIPALVCLGVRARVSGFMTPVWRYLGEMSYPFYILHMPIVKGVRHLASVVWHDTLPAPLMLCVGLGLSWLVSELALRLYDIPVRTWLMARYGQASRKTMQRPAPKSFGNSLSGQVTGD